MFLLLSKQLNCLSVLVAFPFTLFPIHPSLLSTRVPIGLTRSTLFCIPTKASGARAAYVFKKYRYISPLDSVIIIQREDAVQRTDSSRVSIHYSFVNSWCRVSVCLSVSVSLSLSRRLIHSLSFSFALHSSGSDADCTLLPPFFIFLFCLGRCQ